MKQSNILTHTVNCIWHQTRSACWYYYWYFFSSWPNKKSSFDGINVYIVQMMHSHWLWNQVYSFNSRWWLSNLHFMNYWTKQGLNFHFILFCEHSPRDVAKTFLSFAVSKWLYYITEHCLLEPVGDGHHDVEGSKEEDKMEVGIAVDGSLSLIICHVLASTGLLLIIIIYKAHIKWCKEDMGERHF